MASIDPEYERIETSSARRGDYGVALLGLANRLESGESAFALLRASVNMVALPSSADTIRVSAYQNFRIPFTALGEKIEIPV